MATYHLPQIPKNAAEHFDDRSEVGPVCWQWAKRCLPLVLVVFDRAPLPFYPS